MQLTGKIILTSATDITPEQALEVEQYLNNIIAAVVYANKGVGLRVHLEEKND